MFYINYSITSLSIGRYRFYCPSEKSSISISRPTSTLNHSLDLCLMMVLRCRLKICWTFPKKATRYAHVAWAEKIIGSPITISNPMIQSWRC